MYKGRKMEQGTVIFLSFIFKRYLLIYLAVLSLSCGTWDLVP